MIKFGKQGKEIVISSKAILKGILIVNVLVMVMRIIVAIVTKSPILEEVFDGPTAGIPLFITLMLLDSEEETKKKEDKQENGEVYE